MMKKVAMLGNQPNIKKLAAQCAIQSVVCCALCDTELEAYAITTCRQMGATEPEMICETCWNRIQNEGYENVMP